MSGLLTGLGSILQSSGGGSNWWEEGGATGCVAAYNPKGAASFAASKTNLANPGTHDLTDGVAPGWANGAGWIFDGSDDYLVSDIVLVNNWTLIAQFTTGGALGVYNSGSDRMGINNVGGGNPITFHNGGFDTITPAASGNMGLSGQDIYFNGAFSATIGGTAYAGSGITLYVGAVNVSNSLALFYAAGTFSALAVYNNSLDASEMGAVAAAMAAL